MDITSPCPQVRKEWSCRLWSEKGVRGTRMFPRVRLRITVSVIDLENLCAVGLAFTCCSRPPPASRHWSYWHTASLHHSRLVFLAPPFKTISLGAGWTCLWAFSMQSLDANHDPSLHEALFYQVRHNIWCLQHLCAGNIAISVETR